MRIMQSSVGDRRPERSGFQKTGENESLVPLEAPCRAASSARYRIPNIMFEAQNSLVVNYEPKKGVGWVGGPANSHN